MRPVECGQCGARVLARKASWEQTSVQWDTAAMAACLERRATAPGPGGFPGCTALRGSITRAALDGTLPVLAEAEHEA
jgi:hypothetical protein